MKRVVRRAYYALRITHYALHIIPLTCILTLLIACTPIPDTPTPPPTISDLAQVPTATPTHTPIPTRILAPTYTPIMPASSTPLPTDIPPTATPTPPATPSTRDPYTGLRIEELVARNYGGGELEIVETLERNPRFNRYLIRYPSDDLMVYGFMNVPQVGDDFPVALVLHGFINPEEYKVLDYTTPYADKLADEGYLVIHPNYRNHPPSDAGTDTFRVGYAVDVLNLIAILREQSLDEQSVLRRANGEQMHLMGHSMGGGIALRMMTVRPQWLQAVVLYGSMSGDEAKNYAKIAEWTEGRSGVFERNTSDVELENISPSYHYERSWNVPVSIHHGDDDGTVPLAWSEETCEALEGLGYVVVCYTYPGQPHNFYGGADNRFVERMIEFFTLH